LDPHSFLLDITDNADAETFKPFPCRARFERARISTAAGGAIRGRTGLSFREVSPVVTVEMTQQLVGYAQLGAPDRRAKSGWKQL
jgi:hypothetical protein